MASFHEHFIDVLMRETASNRASAWRLQIGLEDRRQYRRSLIDLLRHIVETHVTVTTPGYLLFSSNPPGKLTTAAMVMFFPFLLR